MVGLVAGLVLLTMSTEEPAKVWVVDHVGLVTTELEADQWVPSLPSASPSATC